MTDILHHRRHRFDALFALLTGRDTALAPQTPRLLRDIGLAEPPRASRAIAHDAVGAGLPGRLPDTLGGDAVTATAPSRLHAAIGIFRP